MSTTLTVSYGAQYTDIGSRRHPSYAIAPRPRTAATRAEKVSGGKFFVGEVSNGRRTERLVGGLGAQRTRSSREFFPDRIRRGAVADCRACGGRALASFAGWPMWRTPPVFRYERAGFFRYGGFS